MLKYVCGSYDHEIVFVLWTRQDSTPLESPKIALFVRRVRLSLSIILAHEKARSKTTAKYPLTRVEVKAITMHSGIYGETLDNVILG